MVVWVAPVRERGLKLILEMPCLKKTCRSREGAWIEISRCVNEHCRHGVAPVRERGLK